MCVFLSPLYCIFLPDWVFKLGPIVNDQYEYSLITDGVPTLQLFVLARDPTTFFEKYDAEVSRVYRFLVVSEVAYLNFPVTSPARPEDR